MRAPWTEEMAGDCSIRRNGPAGARRGGLCACLT
jgi:hypothetical protein